VQLEAENGASSDCAQPDVTVQRVWTSHREENCRETTEGLRTYISQTGLLVFRRVLDLTRSLRSPYRPQTLHRRESEEARLHARRGTQSRGDARLATRSTALCMGHG